MRARGRSRSGAFTLIELLAVLAVLGLTLFFVVPALDNISPGAKLRAQARGIASTIEDVQGKAAETGKEFVMAYDLGRGTYWVILPPPDPPANSTTSGTNPGTTRTTGTQQSAQNGDPQPPLDDAEHGVAPDIANSPSGSGTGTGTGTGTKPSTSTSTSTSYAQRDTVPETQLPDEVKIVSVSPLNAKQTTGGIVYVPFSSLGDEGSHIVVIGLKSANGFGTPDTSLSIRFNALTRTVDISTDALSWQTIDGK
jgi:prepilin-type N-terminal cleavage/methylation domain-containing protein